MKTRLNIRTESPESLRVKDLDPLDVYQYFEHGPLHVKLTETVQGVLLPGVPPEPQPIEDRDRPVIPVEAELVVKEPLL